MACCDAGPSSSSDGRPPPIPLVQSNATIRSVTVTWQAVIVPSSGPLLHYIVTLYNQSDELVFQGLVNATTNRTEFTFEGLQPDTPYRAEVVGVNQFGMGNRTKQPIRTAAPVGKKRGQNNYNSST